MKAIFADTSYWVALANPRDSRRGDALRQRDALAGVVIWTTEEVLSEFLTWFAGNPHWRRLAVMTVADILASSEVVILPQTHDSFTEGLRLYSAREDKEYSLTDCISMQAMFRFGLTEVLTSDHHFEQEGFRALLRG